MDAWNGRVENIVPNESATARLMVSVRAVLRGGDVLQMVMGWVCE